MALVGIARLAADALPLQKKARAEYLGLEIRAILNRCTRPYFDWTINPYRGCEFGCHYCYARYTHEFMELDTHAFEEKIYAKQEAATILRRDLMRLGTRLRSEVIAIGTATDPYQPAERRFGVTRAILEVLAEAEGLRLSITTKSDLVARDLDVLETIARRSSLHINVTITTMRPRLAQLLEPRAPRPDLRMQAVRKLADAGLTVGVFAAPVLPGITDHTSDLDALFQATAENGGQYLMVNPLFLKPCAQKQFLPFLEKEFPSFAASYRKRYEHNAYPRDGYRKRLDEVVAGLRRKYGLPSGPARYAAEEQLSLF
jgi:DNA repair photolyase